MSASTSTSTTEDRFKLIEIISRNSGKITSNDILEIRNYLDKIDVNDNDIPLWLSYFKDEPNFPLMNDFKEENRVKDPRDVNKKAFVFIVGHPNYHFFLDNLYGFEFEIFDKYTICLKSSSYSYIIDCRHPEYCILAESIEERLKIKLVKSKLYFYLKN